MYDVQSIANRIKHEAKLQNYKLSVMLKELGLGINAISQLSNGQEMSYLTFAGIADYLNCSVDYLLGRTNEPNGVYQNSNSGNIVNGNNGDNSPLTVNGNARSDTEEIVELIQGLPLVQRAKIITQIDEMKNKKMKG